MKPKIEKTEHGKVKAVGISKKKIKYGDVDPWKTPTGGKEGKKGESSDDTSKTPLEPSQEPNFDSSDGSYTTAPEKGTVDYAGIIESLLASMKSSSSSDKDRSDDSDEKDEKEDEKPKKKRDDMLTQYLTLQLRLKALAEVLGAVKVSEAGKTYYSFSAINSVGIEVTKLTTAKSVILYFDTFPWFDSEKKAMAFLELCPVFISEYCYLMSHLNPLAVIEQGDIEVIHS